MRFIGRSREGTLTVYTVFIFLLCIVLFMLFSWILLAVYSRNEATSTARSHLTFIKQAYQAHSDTLKDDLGHVATNADLIATLKQQPASLATQSFPTAEHSWHRRGGLVFEHRHPCTCQ